MEGCLFIIILIIIISALVGIWNFIFWIGLQKLIIIIYSFIGLYLLGLIILVIYTDLKTIKAQKERAVNIIKTGNLQRFNQFLDRDKIDEIRGNFLNIKHNIYPHLYNITDIEKINIICQKCFKNRNPLLVKLIVDKEWIASEPASAKVYSILKTNQLKLIENSDGEEIKYLLDSLKDKDPEIANRAKQSLEEIRIINQHGIDYLCQEWLFKKRDKFLESLIIKYQYQALSPVRVKILTAFLHQKLSLLKNEGEEGAEILLEFLHNQDTNLASNSLKVLHNLTNQEGINYLCQQWANHRDKQLEEIIIHKQYLATSPVKLKILTAFLHQKLSLLKNEGEEGVEILLEFLHNQDTNLASNSLKVLHNLTNQEGINYLCQQWVNNRDNTLEKIIIRKQYYATFPSDIKILTALKTGQLDLLSNLNLEETIILINTLDDSDQVIVNNIKKIGDFLLDSTCKSLICFITEQWKKYEHIDFDQNLLKNVFAHADSSLRQKITKKIKISGRSDWLQVIFAERKRKNIESMTDYDWQVTVELFSKTDHDLEKWKLAQQAPPFYSQQLLKQIHDLNFINGEKSVEQHLFYLGKKVIFNSSDLAIWVNDNSELETIHECRANYLVINGEGNLLASASSEDKKNIELRNLPSGKRLEILSNDNNRNRKIKGLVMNREGTLLASAKDPYSMDGHHVRSVIQLWELPSGRLLRTLLNDYFQIAKIVMNEEGTLLASQGNKICLNEDNSYYLDEDGNYLYSEQIELRKLPSGQLLNTIFLNIGYDTLVMNREGTLLASGSKNYTIILRELPSGRPLHILSGHTNSITSLVINRESSLLASGSKDCTMKLWELPSGRLLHTLTGHTDSITSLVMNEESNLLASASLDHTIKLWKLPSGRLLDTVIATNTSGYYSFISSLVMNTQGTLLVSGDHRNGKIKLWKLHSLDRLPLSKVINHSGYIQDTLKREDLTKNERNWFEFILALINNYRRFEIDIEDAPIITEAGEFDIEIEE